MHFFLQFWGLPSISSTKRHRGGGGVKISNNQSDFPWAQIVLPYWLTYYYILKKHISFKSLCKKRRKLFLWPSNPHLDIFDILSIKNCNFYSLLTQYIPVSLKYRYHRFQTPVSYLDSLLEKDANANLTAKLYDKRNCFNFSIVSFP